MIPQKFLMMKCIRILFLLHVVGILFFAYKLYNIYNAPSKSQLGASRSGVSWKQAANYTKGDKYVGANRAVVDKVNVGVEDLEDDEDEKLGHYENDEEEYEAEPTNEEEEENLEDQDDIDDENQEETTDVDEYDDDYEEENEEIIKPRPERLPPRPKVVAPDLVFKGVQGQSVSVPAAALKNSHWTLTSAGKYNKQIYTPPLNEKPLQRLPQALVIGSPNSGIRPLLDFLEIHPQIVPVKKEVPLFDQLNRLQFHTNWFISQMPLSYSNQVTVGRTHFSHWTKKSVCDLYSQNKNMRIIVVLRDPVSRILSQATAKTVGRTGQLTVAQQGDTLRVNNDTAIVEWGRYVEYVKMWTQCFPKFQIHYVEWSDIMQHPGETVHKIEGFLGVPYRASDANYQRDEERRVYCIHPLHIKGTVCLSEKKGKSPTLSSQEEALIYKFYSKHNEELFKLLGQRYQWGPTGV